MQNIWHPSFQSRKGQTVLAALIVAILTLSMICLAGASSGEEQPSVLTEMGSGDIGYDPQSLIVVNTDASEVGTLSRLMGASTQLYFDGKIAVLTLPDGLSVGDVCNDGRYSKFIGKFHLNQTHWIDTTEIQDQCGYYSMSEAWNRVNLDDTWDVTEGAGVTVAVLDTGLSSTISGFDDNLDGRSCNIITGDTVAEKGRSVLDDQINHGTIVSSIIARGDTGSGGFIGMAPECNLLVVKITNERSISEENIVAAIDYAVRSGADVINMSFGGGYSYSKEYALSLAAEAGVVCVTSSGNDSTYKPQYPAYLDTTISVGSIDYRGELSSFSNYGYNDIVAPGEFRVNPDGSVKRGTSFSAPMVAGAVALYLSAHSDIDADEVKNLLCASAVNNGLNNDYRYGSGILDVDTFVLGETGTITYDLMTDGTSDVTQTFYYGVTVGNTYIPVASDATFLYWYGDDPDTPTMPYDHAFTDDVTLYAMWSEGRGDFELEYVGDNSVLIKKYMGSGGSVDIPEKIHNMTVVGISPMAFEGCTSISHLSIPDTAEYLGIYAFSGCTGLRELVLPATDFTYGTDTFALGTEDDPVECVVYGAPKNGLTTNEYTVFEYRDAISVCLSNAMTFLDSGYVDVDVWMLMNTGVKKITLTIEFNSDCMYPAGYSYTGNKVQISYDFIGTCKEYYAEKGYFDSIKFVLNDNVQSGMYPLTLTVSGIETYNGRPLDTSTSSGMLFVMDVPGDLNGDRKVSSADSLLLRKYLANYDIELIGNGDLNGDREIGLADSLRLRQYIAGMDVVLFISCEPSNVLVNVFGTDFCPGMTADLYVQNDDLPCVTKNYNAVTPEYCYGSTYRIATGDDTYLVSVAEYMPTAGKTSSITYILNGGTADPSSPADYTEGSDADLGCPTHPDGKMFLGWYLDEECTTNMLHISDGTCGDLTLYAKWGDSPEGCGYTLDMSGKYAFDIFGFTASYDIAASLDVSTLACDPSHGYLLQQNMTLGMMGIVTQNKEISWQNDGMYIVKDFGYETIDIGGWILDADHKRYSAQELNIDVYLIYGWLPVSMIYQVTGDGYAMTLSGACDRIHIDELPEKRTVTVYSGSGIDVEYSPTVSFGGYEHMTAVSEKGTTFAGWYGSDGQLLSTSTTLSLGPIYDDTTIYALNSKASDMTVKYGETVTIDPGLEDVTWDVIDEMLNTSYNGTTLTIERTEDCMILYSGIDSDMKVVNKVLFISVNKAKGATVVRDYVWEYDGEQYSLSLSIRATDIIKYRDYADRYNRQDADHALEFITYNDSYVKSVSSYIKKNTAGMSDYDRLMVLMRFVQCAIPYEYDYVSMGVNEYWKFPLETLFDGVGDCEDTAILFCAIGKAMGYDVALMLFSDHAAGGIGISTFGYTVQDNIYYKKMGSLYVYYLGIEGELLDYAYRESAGSYYLFCETTDVSNIGESWYYGVLKPEYDKYSSCNVEDVVKVV